MKKKRIILLIALAVAVLLGIAAYRDLNDSGTAPDYDDPESLWALAERTEKYIIQANPDKESPARKEAMKALEDIARLDVSYDEKARLIRERFPEESFWNDDMKDMLKRAEAGDADAQYQLGCFYTWKQPFRLRDTGIDLGRGRCIMKSEALAGKWFRKAAMQGHAAAQYRLGWCYLHNADHPPVLEIGSKSFIPRPDEDAFPPGHPASKNMATLSNKAVEQIKLEANGWLVKAAENGDYDAMFYALFTGLADRSPELSAKKEQLRESVLAALLEAAGRGDMHAALAAANFGYGLELSDSSGVEWCRKAVELGSVTGMAHYANALERNMAGNADAADAETVKQWRQKAFDTAMKQLDEGNAEDLNELFKEAAFLPHLEDYLGGEDQADFVNRLTPRVLELMEHGDYEFAPVIIASLFYCSFGDKPEFPDLNRKTINRRFGELGSFHDQFYAAMAKGKGTPEEKAEMLGQFRKLAGLGYPAAQDFLGFLLVDGSHIPRDKPEGVKWLRKAAEQRDYEAMGFLCQSLRSGDPPKNWFEAVGWGLKGYAYMHGYDSVLEYLYNDVTESRKRIGSRR